MSTQVFKYSLIHRCLIPILVLTASITSAQKPFNRSYDIEGGFNGNGKFFTSACDSSGIFVLGEYPYYKNQDSSRYYIQNIMLRFDYDGNLLWRKDIIEPDSTDLNIYYYPSVRKNDSIYFFHYLYYKNGFNYYRRVVVEVNIRTGEILRSNYLPKYEKYSNYSLAAAVYDPESGQLIFPTIAYTSDSQLYKLFVFSLDSNLNIVETATYGYPGSGMFLNQGIVKQSNGLYGVAGGIYKVKSKYLEAFPAFAQLDSNLNLVSLEVHKELEKFNYSADNFSPTQDVNGNWVIYISKDTIETPLDTHSFNNIAYIMKFNPRGDSLIWGRRMIHPHFQFNGFVYFQFAMGRCKDGSGYIALERNIRGTIDSTTYTRMFKVSEQGDSLWSRNLYILGPDETSWYNELNPITHTPYNTFVVQGSAGIVSTGQYRPWLVHFDYHGCVVPGCHLTVNSEDPSSIDPEPINVFPNPVNGQHLYFTCRTCSGQHAQLEFLNLDGRSILRKNIVLENNAQYLLLLPQDLANGYYLLQIHDEINSWSQKVYVQR